MLLIIATTKKRETNLRYNPRVWMIVTSYMFENKSSEHEYWALSLPLPPSGTWWRWFSNLPSINVALIGKTEFRKSWGKSRRRRQENPNCGHTIGYISMLQWMLLTWVTTCDFHLDVWEAFMSFPFVKDAPLVSRAKGDTKGRIEAPLMSIQRIQQGFCHGCH